MTDEERAEQLAQKCPILFIADVLASEHLDTEVGQQVAEILAPNIKSATKSFEGVDTDAFMDEVRGR